MSEAAPPQFVPRTSSPTATRPRFFALTEGWRQKAWVGYTTAVVSTAVALGVTSAFQVQLSRVIFVLFFLAVGITSWVGGFGPALVAIILAILSVDYFILEPKHAFGMWTTDTWYALIAFGAVSTLISWLATSQRRLSFEFADQASTLQEQNIELEIQMEESQSLQEELEQTSEELANRNDDLARNSAFLAQAQASAQLGSWEWDFRHNRLHWSDQMYRILGVESSVFEPSFESGLKLVHPDDASDLQRVLKEAVERKHEFALDFRMVLPNGSPRWVHAAGKTVFDADGDTGVMVGSLQDITDRKNALHAQRLLAEASEALASSLDYKKTLATVARLAVRDVADWCSVAIGDSSGRYENLAVAHRDPERQQWVEEYTRLNPPRFDTPTGVPQVLRTGKPELYPEINDELLQAAATTSEERRVIRELGLRSAMVVPMAARGRTIGAISFVSAESGRRYDANDMWFAERLANRAAYAIDNAHLFEEAQQAKLDAEAANAAKAQFLASMSHELRTPLNAIGGYAELIEVGVLGPVTEKQADALARLRRSRKHLNALVEQVLSFARIEAGKVNFTIAPVPVRDSLHRLADMFEPQAGEKKLNYDFDGCDPGLAVLADRERLDQILLNLLGNAIKYTPSDGAISVSVDCDPARVNIHVRDTGPGVPAEKQEMIFEPFVQLGSTSDASASGVGLGLAISRDLARGMGGDIGVQSIDGQGATFTLSLPRATDQPVELRRA